MVSEEEKCFCFVLTFSVSNLKPEKIKFYFQDIGKQTPPRYSTAQYLCSTDGFDFVNGHTYSFHPHC